MNIMMVKEDVSIEPIEQAQCENQGRSCTGIATHRMLIDFRAAGITRHIGDFCETCANELNKWIQDSLPEDESQERDGTRP